MFKKQTGITLVALVVTIIVLLILAGVSISLVVGNNGVITQASSSVIKTRAAEAKQALELAIGTAETQYQVRHVGNSAELRDTPTVEGGEIVKYDEDLKTELGNQGYSVEYLPVANNATAPKTIVADAAVKVKLTKGNESVIINVRVDDASGATEIDPVITVGTDTVTL